MRRTADSTGLTAPVEQGCPSPGPVPNRPPGTAWITDEAIADTRRVWSPYYGRDLTEDEAIEILMNVKGLAQTLVQTRRRRQACQHV